MSDVVIVGGGVIGLSIAYELAKQDVDVTVLEQGAFGQEASWAGAGILPPGGINENNSPYENLRGESAGLWPSLSSELLEETGIDNGFRQCGGIEVRFDGSQQQLTDEVAEWVLSGAEAFELAPQELHRLEPAISHEAVAAYSLPGLGQVRNPRHVKALLAACALRGVRLISSRPVTGFTRRNGKILSVETPEGPISGGQFCVASGAWSRRVLASIGVKIAVEPVRGQIVLLQADLLPFRRVLQVGPRYLVPRPDGAILVGSTEEHAGFEKRNTAVAISDLINFAIEVVPALAEARFERAWAGLRPGSPDGLPYLGAVPETENLYVACGHFRSGLQLSPGTGLVMRQAILGQTPAVPLEAFSFDRGSSPAFAAH